MWFTYYGHTKFVGLLAQEQKVELHGENQRKDCMEQQESLECVLALVSMYNHVITQINCQIAAAISLV